MFLRLAALVLTTFLASCASAPPALPSASTVSVVSLLGNTLKVRQVGFMVFGNSARGVDVAAWNVDAHVEEMATAALTGAGRKATRAPPGSARDIGKSSFTTFTSSYTFAGGAAGLQKVALAAHADYLILVLETPEGFPDPFFRTNQSITGFGVYQKRGGGGAIAYADTAMLLVNGKTGEVMDRRRAYEGKPRADDAWLDIDNDQASVTALGQTPDEFLGVVDATVRKGLGYLGMLPRS